MAVIIFLSLKQLHYKLYTMLLYFHLNDKNRSLCHSYRTGRITKHRTSQIN